MHENALASPAAGGGTAPGSPAKAAGAVSSAAAAPVRAPAGRPRTGKGRAPVRSVIVAIVLLAVVNVAGASYYWSVPAERVRSELHVWLRPSGIFGQTAGILSFALFAFMWLYPLRKKAKRLSFLGPIGRWLDFHIAAGLVLPLLAATHAAWRFTGLIGLGYAAMLVVSLSGVLGRYLYVRIPRSKSGLALTAGEIREERGRLLEKLATAAGLPAAEIERALAVDRAPSRGLLGFFASLVRDDLARRRATGAFIRQTRERQGATLDRSTLKMVRHLARRQVALDQQMRMLDATHRALRYWHVAHRPIAITAFLAVLAHIVVAIAVGATWFR